MQYVFRITEVKYWDVVAESEDEAREIFYECGGDEYSSHIDDIEVVGEVEY